MAQSVIQEKIKTKTVTFTIDDTYISNPETITAYRFGNVIAVRLWGTKIKANAPAAIANVLKDMPACAQQGNAHLGLAGQNTVNLQGNIYNAGVNNTNITIGLKQGYAVETPLYASLIYIAK